MHPFDPRKIKERFRLQSIEEGRALWAFVFGVLFTLWAISAAFGSGVLRSRALKRENARLKRELAAQREWDEEV